MTKYVKFVLYNFNSLNLRRTKMQLTENDNLHQGVAARIAELLIERDMKQSELAEKVGVDASVVSSWISGRRGVPQDKKIQICEQFNIPLTELNHFNCEIPVYGEVQDNFEIIDFDPIKFKKRLLIKNLFFPSDCVGYIYGNRQEYNWRFNAIWVVRVVKGRWADKNECHPQCDGRFNLIQITGGKKMLGVPHSNTDGSYNIHSIGDGTLLLKGQFLDYAIPILAGLPNWGALIKSFHPDLEV
jgi:transcriptional regulator with XRE-family HTH domain